MSEDGLQMYMYNSKFSQIIFRQPFDNISMCIHGDPCIKTLLQDIVNAVLSCLVCR